VKSVFKFVDNYGRYLHFCDRHVCSFPIRRNAASTTRRVGRYFALGNTCPVQLFLVNLYFFRRATSEMVRPIAVKLCHVIGIWVRFIMQVQNFGGPPPKEIGGQKHAKFWPISYNFRLWSRISPERVKISKIGKTDDETITAACHQKTPVNFGPLTTENCIWVWTHPNCIFRETISRPLGGAGPWYFITH